MDEKVGVSVETPEEKLAADAAQNPLVAKLTAEIESMKDELGKAKNTISRTNSEAAEYKRQLREKQTKEEAEAAERAERERKRDEELETLRAQAEAWKRERTTANYSKALMGVGYDAETADLIANTLPDGVGTEFFDGLKAFQDKQRQAIITESYSKQPSLSVGTPPQSAEDLEMARLRKSIGL